MKGSDGDADKLIESVLSFCFIDGLLALRVCHLNGDELAELETLRSGKLAQILRSPTSFAIHDSAKLIVAPVEKI